MTDDQIRWTFGVAESRKMLQIRETIKSQMTPELYEQNMAVHKASIQTLLDQAPGGSPLLAAEAIVDTLDADTSVDDDQREIWKALVVVAAFEMTEL